MLRDAMKKIAVVVYVGEIAGIGECAVTITRNSKRGSHNHK